MLATPTIITIVEHIFYPCNQWLPMNYCTTKSSILTTLLDHFMNIVCSSYIIQLVMLFHHNLTTLYQVEDAYLYRLDHDRTLLYVTSSRNRTSDLLILSPTPYPLGHCYCRMFTTLKYITQYIISVVSICHRA